MKYNTTIADSTYACGVGHIDPLLAGSNGISSRTSVDEYVIKGQMVSVSFVVSQSEDINAQINSVDYKNTIKKKLCHLMAEELYKQNFFSFTMADDPISDTKTFYARMFVTPSSHTQIIRKTLTKK